MYQVHYQRHGHKHVSMAFYMRGEAEIYARLLRSYGYAARVEKI
jgi:hypothetical protein